MDYEITVSAPLVVECKVNASTEEEAIRKATENLYLSAAKVRSYTAEISEISADCYDNFE